MDSTFAPIIDVAQIMQGFPAPWFVAGGWAIDLFLGQVTRPHHDIEIGIYRCDQQTIRQHLPDWSLDKAVQTPEGGKWIPWTPDEYLQLPVHQIRAISLHDASNEFEFFLNECDTVHWTSRRHADLRIPLTQVLTDSFLMIPILAPEIQLLFKAKNTRQKDQADFERTVPRLSSSQTEWLSLALQRYYPEHPWLSSPVLS